MIAKLHHYVPQGYLRAFTDKGNRDGLLYALDLASRNACRTKPRNIAAEKDFNRVDIEGLSPDFLERGFGELESKAIDAMRVMAATNQLASNDDLVYVIKRITLLVVRNPKNRRSISASRKHLARVLANMLVSNRRIWDSTLKQGIAAGAIKKRDISFEDMRRFVTEERFTISDRLHLGQSTMKEVFKIRCSLQDVTIMKNPGEWR